jgi:TIR domain
LQDGTTPALLGGHGSPDYRYDIFVSYKREPTQRQLVTPWLREVLMRIEYWLRQEMGGRRVDVFFDEESIEVGDKWPDEIREALLTAKCLLPVWSPEYFHSKWCVAEWRSFLAREKLITDSGKVCRLIVPIKFHDGRWFPAEAQRVQQLDLSRYTATTQAFWSSRRADELDQEIMRFAPALARVVSAAPPYEMGWPIDPGEPNNPPSGVGMPRL